MKAEKCYLNLKEITAGNWSEPDKTSSIFCQMNDLTGEVSYMSGDDWAKHFLEPQLNSEVPISVQRLYEVARGALIYGYYFYPLYNLGIEQLSRVAESAITEKCSQLKLLPINQKKKKDSLFDKLNALNSSSVVKNFDFDYWQTTREIRNCFSHPENQNLSTPGTSLTFLREFTEKVNQLFS